MARSVSGQKAVREVDRGRVRAVAEEALCEAQARIDRAIATRVRAEHEFVAELRSVKQTLRCAAAEVSGARASGMSAVSLPGAA